MDKITGTNLKEAATKTDFLLVFEDAKDAYLVSQEFHEIGIKERRSNYYLLKLLEGYLKSQLDEIYKL